MTRAELAAEAAQLRADGLLQREIADRLGISRSYAAELLCDPNGTKARARKASYRGVCEGCGAATDGSNGRTAAPRLCAACFALARHEGRWWTQERIIGAFREFERQAGRPPAAADSHLPVALSLRARCSPERVAEADRHGHLLPYPECVRREFGGWSQALTAAGMPPSPAGGAPAHRTYGPLQTAVLDYLDAWDEPRRVRDIAAALNLRPSDAWKCLASLIRHGLVIRTGRGIYTTRMTPPMTTTAEGT